ncbi:GNAT family N-acetyltransferase [Mucilaginibacter phyllosphaerae]|uniref:GNAT family N-acetyltransferase n=1 Tax=Mucilaginibacter phyllosphaerae TaxID=1812349 RepID=A0A4Y8ADQ7_9SPHI|nr:GNAT family N-acetyltransferase [Mucilaginibacter phyllosphaerae]MBB3969109.1 ribosomal protein S18 acetylase RimI-like enzyme [Mucilaginibacter phyllosphaerae]TEW66076.1 GNAT family N-acetyltransferase [Mucilaginibacter phyllosphaerae]GGH06305.1 N-acetyltransferase [Mucilaginibacter phyllosphaerae]
MPNNIQISKVNVKDAATLLELSRTTFFDAFLHQNNPADMEAYAAAAFTLPKIQLELNNPDSEFYFALVGGAVAGYLKLNYNAAQTELKDAHAVEVERIYVLNSFQGQQVGKQLMEFAMQQATSRQLKYIWLGVWEHNTKAIGFYKIKGFGPFGSHNFMLGSDEQTDILMKKEL